MYLAYLDESGDSGLTNSPTRYFVLSCVLVDEAVWLTTLDSLVALRRDLRTRYNIPTRPELKARHLKTCSGVLRGSGMSLSARMTLYRDLMRYQPRNLNIKTFSVAIEKAPARANGWEARYAAWTFALQRINRFCGDQDWAMIFPDEGHGYFIRSRMRHMRRYHVVPSHWGPGNIPFPTERILEDPNERKSQDSYFIQLADWNAYAAHRSRHIDPLERVPDTLWDELGAARVFEVTAVRGGPPGIVKYP